MTELSSLSLSSTCPFFLIPSFVAAEMLHLLTLAPFFFLPLSSSFFLSLSLSFSLSFSFLPSYVFEKKLREPRRGRERARYNGLIGFRIYDVRSFVSLPVPCFPSSDFFVRTLLFSLLSHLLITNYYAPFSLSLFLSFSHSFPISLCLFLSLSLMMVGWLDGWMAGRSSYRYVRTFVVVPGFP